MADWEQVLEDARAHEAEQCRQRRELVLRYPDIAAKLCAPPLKHSRPEVWNGSLPGPYLPEGADGRVRPNRSPVRAQLLAVLTEAAARADHERTPA